MCLLLTQCICYWRKIKIGKTNKHNNKNIHISVWLQMTTSRRKYVECKLVQLLEKVVTTQVNLFKRFFSKMDWLIHLWRSYWGNEVKLLMWCILYCVYMYCKAESCQRAHLRFKWKWSCCLIGSRDACCFWPVYHFTALNSSISLEAGLKTARTSYPIHRTKKKTQSQ